MNKIEYFKYALINRLPSKLEWIYSMFSKPLVTTKYVKVDNGKYYLKIDGELIAVSLNGGNSIFTSKDVITLDNTSLPNITGSIDTTVGRAMVNYICLVVPFKDKIAYQNDMVNMRKIHKSLIITRLSTDNDPKKITIDEYNKFGVALAMMRSLADIFVISSTEKAILPPEGIDEYRAKTIKEFKTKYGNDVFKDKIKVVELETLLKAYDDEWLKDDPSYGISLTPKIMNTSRKKRYLAFGAEDGILPTEEAIFVENSLLDGYPEDKKQLAAMFNTTIAGSYARGKETQDSGVISDKLIRAFTGFKVEAKDCKTIIGKDLIITTSNYISLIGRNHFVAKKTILIDTETDAKALIGKTINLRSMLYCKTKGSEFCSLCAGRNISRTKNGILLMGLDMGAAAMKAKLKKMHANSLSLYHLELSDIIN